MTATATTSPTEQLRLELRAPTPGRRTDHFVDGGWWPHSHDLVSELGSLLSAVEAAGYGAIRRVTYNPEVWDEAPRRIVINGQLIKLGAFHTQPDSLVTLMTNSGWGNIDLVAIPSDTDQRVAGRALHMAGDEHDMHRSNEILELAEETTAEGPAESPATERWDSEGGH